ncbi:unnamed protein product [Darwinula stevensoni]|uniref:Clathrin light chain n=1 Tax=Darwinula stevensoni TaxID=69355 RepID=A0A7R9A9P7_9CRUS|nr:unnamed protein product [Darwinula stevensoni]CAG0897592.1 unnamed protein product [Darwinula stevensoni]
MSGMMNGEVDPAAEFLAREQDQLAGLEDDFPPVSNGQSSNGASSYPPGVALQHNFKRIDLTVVGLGTALGLENRPHDSREGSDLETTGPLLLGQEPQQILPTSILGHITSEAFDEKDGFVDLASQSQSDWDVTGQMEAEEMSSSSPIPEQMQTRYQAPLEEPEKIKKWREDQRIRLEKKDAEEEKAKLALREQAKRELEEWYKNHEEQISKTKSANRAAEKEYHTMSTAVEPGQEWERIAKLCEFNPKHSRGVKDTSRMRSIILQLKQSPLQNSS